MIALLSPSKSLDFKPLKLETTTDIRFKEQTLKLVKELRKKSSNELVKLMKVSEKIADLNYARFQNFENEFDTGYAKASLFAFKGEVYVGLDALSLTTDEIKFAQSHIRILSGLYGLLRPLDLLQPYRLEMGTKLGVGKCKNLYEFWGNKIGMLAYNDLQEIKSVTIVNLASHEYFKAVKPYFLELKKKNKIKVIDVQFLDESKGTFKIIPFYAKKARGMMAKYICNNKVTNPEQLVSFDFGGYQYDSSNSDGNSLIFKRLQR